MTRALDAATLSALEAATATPIYFVELGPFNDTSPESYLRLHTGIGTITWNSLAWTGAGDLASIDSVRESTSFRPEAIRMGLSGVSSDVTNVVFNTNYYRRPCKMYLGALSDGALVADPSIIFSGFIQKIDMVMGAPDGDRVLLTAESELILFKRSRDVRYTDNELQSEYSGDLGLQFLESVATQKVVWRGTNNNLGGGGGGGGGGGSGDHRRQRDHD
jgi:hypothetical protein